MATRQEVEQRMTELYTKDVTQLTLDELKRDYKQLQLVISNILDRTSISAAGNQHSI